MKDQKIIEARILLCEYLRKTAIEKGIYQEEIANKTGFTQSNVSRMLSGKYPPSLDNFIKLAEAIGVYFFIIDKNTPDDELVNIMKNRWNLSSPN